MDVLSLLVKRTKSPIGISVRDNWLEEIVKSDADEIAIVLTENALNQTRMNGQAIVTLREKYNLDAMFDLKNPYANTNASFFLYVFTKKKNDTVKYGIYKETINKRCVRADALELHEAFHESYFTYIEAIESFIDTGVCPVDTDEHEFGVFDSNIRKERCWNPNRYNKAAMRVREALKKEKTISLGDVATVIRPRPDEERKHTEYCAMPGAWQYPVDYSKMRSGVLTDCALRKGDIVFLDSKRMFLIYDETEHELHTSPNCFVIRPNNICPEYLFMYLMSETAQIVMEFESFGAVIQRIRKEDLVNLPVIFPEKDGQYYKRIFYVEYFPVNDIEEINRTIFDSNVSEDGECIEDILDLELINRLKVYKEDIKEKILDEDLKEINICFRHGAYKATLILAGSILEAVLIDWLSELHGKNYFEEEYIDHRGKQGTLAIYIRDIKYLKRPGWIDEAEKAYTIKEKRNQVHAKLCLNAEEINEELCREVIGYLTDVLKTRNGKANIKKVPKRD